MQIFQENSHLNKHGLRFFWNEMLIFLLRQVRDPKGLPRNIIFLLWFIMDVLNYRFYTPIALLRQLLVYNIESKAFGISILIQNASNSFVYFQQNFLFFQNQGNRLSSFWNSAFSFPGLQRKWLGLIFRRMKSDNLLYRA